MKAVTGALAATLLALWPDLAGRGASPPLHVATYSPPAPAGASAEWCSDRGRRYPPGQLRTVCARRDLRGQCTRLQCMACLPDGRWRYDEGRC